MNFKEALNFRHACKIFDENKKIDEREFIEILEAGRLSPSSMGMQPWEFEVIENFGFLQNLRQVCWNQPQITTAAKVLVIYAKIADLKPNSEYIKRIIAQRGKSSEEQMAFLERYAKFFVDNVGESDLEIYSWSRAQCFLAAQNMMMAAATQGIDSCAIEGYEIPKLENLLAIERDKKRVALILTFGYRVNPQSQKFRLELEQIVTNR